MKPRAVRRRLTFVSGAEFKDIRLKAGLNRAAAATLLRVTLRTVRNWDKPQARVPWLAYELLRIHGCHELPGDAWHGWRVMGDSLYSPESLAFAAHEAGWWSLTCSMARQWLRQQERRMALFTGPISALAPQIAERAAHAGAAGPTAPRSAADVGRAARTREPQEVEP